MVHVYSGCHKYAIKHRYGSASAGLPQHRLAVRILMVGGGREWVEGGEMRAEQGEDWAES